MSLIKLGTLLKTTTYLTLIATTALPLQHAQAAEAADAASVLGEIVVTARKREESLQLVPVSVTAISAANLEAKSLTTLRDVGQFTPNFSFSSHGQGGSSAGLIYIRGIGQSDPHITNEPGVGIYLDGVYFGRMQGLDLDMMDLERIEILRGPQGTLFGKNTIGGAVNIVSAKPSNDFAARAQITTGRYDRIDATASVNLPMVEDRLAVRLSGSTRNRDGFGQRMNGEDMGDVDSLSGRASILVTPNENLELLAAIDGSRIREKGPARKVLATSQPFAIGLMNMFIDPPYDERWLTDSDFTNYATDGNASESDLWGASFTATWKIGDYSVKSITAYRSNKSYYAVDPDGSPIAIIDEDARSKQDQFSQEFQVNGVSFDDRLTWVAGVYYFTEDGKVNMTDVVLLPLYYAIGMELNFNTNLHIDNKSYAAYAQGTYAVTDQLNLTAGIRYTYEKKYGDTYRFRPLTGEILIPFTSGKENWEAFSPRVGVEYRWNDDIMTYVSAAHGFKSGGFNGRADAADGFTSYDPEKVWTFEAGWRSDLLEKKLRFNATVYVSKYRDIQFTVIKGNENAQPTSQVDNAGKATIKGAEIELVAVPAQGLTLNAALGLTDAEYTQVDPGSDITTSSHFVKTPKWTATIGGQYVMPISNSFELISQLDYAYKSKIYHDSANSPLIVQKGYGLLNGRLTFQPADGPWSVAVFGTNLTNKHYIQAGTDFLASLGFAEVQFARPREWGASFEYRF